MNRTRIRQRSPTNSRPHENIPLRRSYLEQNPICEFHILCPMRFPSKDAVDPHHIFSAHMRPDYWSNLIAVSRDAHEVAERHKTDMRIAAIYRKVMKGEFDPIEFKIVSGMYIAGYLAKSELVLDWTRPYLETLLEKFP